MDRREDYYVIIVDEILKVRDFIDGNWLNLLLDFWCVSCVVSYNIIKIL